MKRLIGKEVKLEEIKQRRTLRDVNGKAGAR